MECFAIYSSFSNFCHNIHAVIKETLPSAERCRYAEYIVILFDKLLKLMMNCNANVLPVFVSILGATFCLAQVEVLATSLRFRYRKKLVAK